MTNWEALFSTPEKTAETIDEITTYCSGYDDSGCYLCPVFMPCNYGNYLEWLQEEAS